MDQQQPKIPTLKDSQKPQVKVRGLGAGLTLFDRLKQFKKKDLAFILAGLGTLFMAPLAEHFMMAPDAGDSALRPGFGGGPNGGQAGGIFGSNGNMGWDQRDGLAPGGPTGGGSDIITPLNVRDPSALVMGPGATQQPPTSSVAPQTPPPTAPVARNDSDLKDALAASARGATAAAKKALMPIPKIALNSSGLRGLGAVQGGSSNVAGPISSSNLAPNHANAGGGGLNEVSKTPGYRGVASGRGPGQGGHGIEDLAAAAARQAGSFNRTGSAASDLGTAASQSIGGGGSGFNGYGQGGSSANDKGAGGNQNKDGKNQGESLAFMKAKMDMEKAEELKWKKIEAGDTKLQMLQWRNKIGEAVAGKIGEGLGSWITCPMTKGYKKCWTPAANNGEWICDGQSNGIDGGTVGQCGNDGIQWTPGPLGADGKATLTGCTAGSKDGPPSTVDPSRVLQACKPIDGAQPGGSSSGAGPKGPAGGVSSSAPVLTGGQAQAIANLGRLCSDVDKFFANPTTPKTGPAMDYAKSIKGAARAVVVLRGALGTGTAGDSSCASSVVPVTDPTVSRPQVDGVTKDDTVVSILSKSASAAAGADGAIPLMKAGVPNGIPNDNKVPGADKLAQAQTLQGAADTFIGTIKTSVQNNSGGIAAPPDDMLRQVAADQKDALKAWPQQVSDARSGLGSEIGAKTTDSGNLKTSLRQVGWVANPDDQQPATLAEDMKVNSALDTGVRQKVQQGAGADLKPANDPGAGKPIPGTAKNPAQRDTMVQAIADARKAVDGSGQGQGQPAAGADPNLANAKAAVDFYTNAQSNFTPYDSAQGAGDGKVQFKTKAQPVVSAAVTSVGAMQSTQNAWLDGLSGQITPYIQPAAH